MPLALLAERSSPLVRNFTIDSSQLLLAMMQPEVLVEPLKHGTQMASAAPAVTSAYAEATTRGRVLETYGNFSRLGCGSPQIDRGDQFYKRV